MPLPVEVQDVGFGGCAVAAVDKRLAQAIGRAGGQVPQLRAHKLLVFDLRHLLGPAAAAARWRGGPSAQGEAAPNAAADAPVTHSYGAHFVEVDVDRASGVVRLIRIVSAFDVGRALNPMLVRSQLHGGIVFGLGMALQEQTLLDPVLGRVVGASLGDYHVPVQADVPDIEVALCERTTMQRRRSAPRRWA